MRKNKIIVEETDEQKKSATLIDRLEISFGIDVPKFGVIKFHCHLLSKRIKAKHQLRGREMGRDCPWSRKAKPRWHHRDCYLLFEH